MFKKTERLSRSEFATFFKSGERYNSPFLTLVYTNHKRLHCSVVVSKKVAKKAHDRNKLRRRVYGKLHNKLKSSTTGVFIVLLKPSFATLTKQEQTEEVQKILSRITMSSN